MIALITPTGARIDQFRICAHHMAKQDYDGKVLWIIVDDGAGVTTDNVQPNFRDKWEITKVYPKPAWQGENTQGRNIKEGVKALIANPCYSDVSAIFIIEDDDYYHANYLTEMVKRMGTYHLIGETNTIYYNVHWRQHVDNNNRQHSSLFQTAFTRDAIPLFITCLHHKFIDAEFWARCHNKYLFHAGTLSIGIKGMPGRGGIGAGHTRSMHFIKDDTLQHLIQLIGHDEAQNYARYYLPQREPLGRGRI